MQTLVSANGGKRRVWVQRARWCCRDEQNVLSVDVRTLWCLCEALFIDWKGAEIDRDHRKRTPVFLPLDPTRSVNEGPTPSLSLEEQETIFSSLLPFFYKSDSLLNSSTSPCNVQTIENHPVWHDGYWHSRGACTHTYAVSFLLWSIQTKLLFSFRIKVIYETWGVGVLYEITWMFL